jgi:ADP-ribose pyrophosphatase
MNKNASDRNRWITETEKEIISSPVMTMVQRESRSSEDGRFHRFYLLKSRDWCNIIPVTETGKVVLVKQHRIGIDEHTLEVPGGVADPTDPDLLAAALRELAEETGYVPLPGAKSQVLGWTHPNPAILNNRCHSFIVGPVRKERPTQLDAGEMIETLEVSFAEIPELIQQGEITHALMLNTFFFLALQSDGGRRALTEQLAAFTQIERSK